MSTLRYESIDQFRGFAILAMVWVNVVGRFAAMPETFRHARFEVISFADAVAPFFFFAVGMGFRISFLRSQSRNGTTAAIVKALKRSLLLMTLGVFVYHFNTQQIFWDALTQIGFGSIIALPVIGRGKASRVMMPFLYAGLLLATGKTRFLGVPFEIESASWPLMILMGSIAMDWVQEDSKESARKILLCGGGLLLSGFCVYFLAPRNVAACVLIYIGMSFLLLEGFLYLNVVRKTALPHLTTLGRNALVVYILHYYIDADMKRLIPDDAGVPMALIAFAVVYVACYSVTRYLENKKYFMTI